MLKQADSCCSMTGAQEMLAKMRNANSIAVKLVTLFASTLMAAEVASSRDAPPNTLTEAEKADSWRLLWDGRSTNGWRSVERDTFPSAEWEMAGGVLTVREAIGGISTGRGNIMTREQFDNFELVVDFNITRGANSGIKYLVQPNLDIQNKTGAGPAVGCEFQILDDERHPDAKLGKNGNRTLGSLYDVIPADSNKKPNPVGEWNTARILVNGNHVQHWLNGIMVLEYARGTAAFRACVAQSKFKEIPGFGEWPKGHILLQEHGDRVHFRNIKIRVLPAN